MILRQGNGRWKSSKGETRSGWGLTTMQEPLQHVQQVLQELGREQG